MIPFPSLVHPPRGHRIRGADLGAPRRFGGGAVLAFLGYSVAAVVLTALLLLAAAWAFDALGLAI